MGNRVRFALSLCTLLILSGCIRPTAVDDFAKVSDQAATLFPAVASIPYNACVANAQNAQLASVKNFDETFDFDQAKIASACKSAQDTSTRLQKTYAVLATYIDTLDKLAGGNVATYDADIKADVSAIRGLNQTQQTAISGLASLIADIFEKHYREREAAKAIHQAQPFVHELSTMLKDQLPPFWDQYLKNETDSLGSMYRDIAVYRVNGAVYHTSPVQATKGFLDDKAVIQKQAAAVQAFETIFVSIDEGHTALDKDRNKLFDKATIQELYQTASDIQKQVAAVESAFAPASAAKK